MIDSREHFLQPRAGFVINAALLWLTDQIIDGFEIEGIGATLGAAVVITVANVCLRAILY